MSGMSALGDAGDSVERDSLPNLLGRESLSLNSRVGAGGATGAGAAGAGGGRGARRGEGWAGGWALRRRGAPMMAPSRRAAAWRRARRMAGEGLAAAPTL